MAAHRRLQLINGILNYLSLIKCAAGALFPGNNRDSNLFPIRDNEISRACESQKKDQERGHHRPIISELKEKSQDLRS
jgi:hypothetical protein